MLVEMKVRGLALDPVSNMPIIILRDEEEKRSLPIWVGIFEANAIALELEKIATPRPMTHDLIKNVLETLDVQVVKVVVTDLKENTFYAVLHLRSTPWTPGRPMRSRWRCAWPRRSSWTRRSSRRRARWRSPRKAASR
jgi:bifunctional DNase/RNase